MPSAAFANAVWQWVFVEKGIFSQTWWVIPATLALESPVVARITHYSLGRAIALTLLLNAASFGFGAIIFMPTMAFEQLGGASGDVIGTAALSTAIEGWLLSRFRPQAMGSRSWLELFLVNLLTTGIAIGAVYHAALHPRGRL